MQTRSQTNTINALNSSALYSVEIDFNEASKAWKQNKVSIGNGSYKYLCQKRSIKNNVCLKKRLPGEDYCRLHLNLTKKYKLT